MISEKLAWEFVIPNASASELVKDPCGFSPLEASDSITGLSLCKREICIFANFFRLPGEPSFAVSGEGGRPDPDLLSQAPAFARTSGDDRDRTGNL